MAGPEGRSSIGVRVRPNSHDFIRHLKADLATKKYTFYVDVGAKTTQATKDVRAWASGPLKAITATVPVGANTGQATLDVAAWRERQRNFKTVIPVHADTSAARAEIASLQAMVKDITVNVRAETSRARADADRAVRSSGGRSRAGSGRSSVDKDFAEGMNKGLEKALAYLDQADTKIEKVKKKASEKIKTKYELDMEDAERDLLKLKLQTKADKLKVPVDFGDGDIKAMRLQLARFRVLEQANKIELKVDAKVSGVDRFMKQLRQIEKTTGSLTVLRSLDLGPLTLGKPTGLIGTLSTITLLAGAVPAAVTAIAALSDALVRLAGAAAIVPGAIGGILASVATLTVGTKGVGDAFSAMFDMWNEGASEQEATAASLISTHDAYANAVKDEAKAQEDVGRARREALGDLRDLNNELRGAVLNEAQAILDVQKARAEYAKGAAKGGLEEQQLRLNVYKAEQGLIDLRERNIDLGQRATEGQQKGVDGSRKVQDALDAQTQAAQSTAKALTALEKAQSGGRSAATKFADALGQLSPNARDFVETFAGMKDEILGFRMALQDTLFQGAGPGFKDLFDSLMPTIGPGMQGIAKEMNKNLLQVFDTLKSPEGESIIDRILGGTADAQKSIGKLINPMVLSIGRLTAAGTEHLPQLIDLFTTLFTRFDAFLKRAEDSGALDKFMDEGIDALSDLAEIGINVIEILHQFSKAFRDSFGEDVLSMLARLTGQFAKFLGDAEGQKKINGYIQEAKDLWAQWKPILEDLPQVFKAVSDAATVLLDAALPVIREIADFMKNNPTLVKGFMTAWLGAKLLTGAFNPIWNLFKGIKVMITGGITLVEKLAAAVRTIPNIPGLPGGTNTLTGPGNTPPIAAAAPKSGLAAAASTAVAALPFLGLTVGFATIANELLKDDPEIKGNVQARGRAGIAGGIKATPGIEVVRGGVDANAAPLPGGIPQPGTREALAGVKQGAINNNPAALWIQGAADAADWKKRYIFAATHPETAGNPFAPPDSYMSGGYTNWGQGAGYPAILHGKEYVQPADTVSHYGVDAMKAVHEKKAAISFAGGGWAPLPDPAGAHGSTGWVPSRAVGKQVWGGWDWTSADWQAQRETKTGRFAQPYVGWNPEGEPGNFNPNMKIDTSTTSTEPVFGEHLPLYGFNEKLGYALKLLTPRGAPPIGRFGPSAGLSRLPGFQGGGYFNPLTGMWEDPADPREYVPHGSAQPAPAPTGQGSLADVLSQGISSGIGAAGNVTDFATSLVQGAGQPGAGGVVDIATGAAPGGPAPGPAGTPAAPGGTGNTFMDSFLGALGIPGLGGNGQQDIGPGWGPNGAPPGLGGNTGPIDPATGLPGPEIDPATGLPKPAMDIRNFGIGPGPPGSGPADWAMFAGQTLGKFGSGLASAFMSGILGFFGISGISSDSLLGGALGIGGHFLGAPGLAGQDDNQPASPEAETLLDMYPDMATNPDYPGVPSLPNIIDPATGKAVPATSLPARGGAPGFSEFNLQPHTKATMRAVAAQFPDIKTIGGYREDPLPDHPNGRGLDVMIPDYNTPEGKAYGDAVNSWIRSHASQLGIKATIWQDQWTDFKGHSSTVGGHMNHIHVQMAADASEVPTPEMVGPFSAPGTGPFATFPTLIDTGAGNATPGVTTGKVPPGYRPGHGGGPRLSTRQAMSGTLPPWLAQLPGAQQGDMNPFAALDPLRLRTGGGTKMDKATIKAIAYRMYMAAGMPPGEWNAFDQLIEHESGWNPTAKNPSSTAFGLGQFLDSTQARFGIGTNPNPLVQLPAIFAYLRERGDYKGSPATAWQLWNSRSPHWYDQGGWLMPGTTNTVNATGMPELIVPYHQIESFQGGGQSFPTGAVPFKPRPPDILRKIGQPPPPPAPTGPPPATTPPAVVPPTPPPSEPGKPPPPGVIPPTAPGPGGGAIGGPSRPATGVGPEEGSHVHPALKKGIASAANTLGSLAAMAVNTGMAAATFGASGAAGAAAGAAGGSLGGFVQGLFQQGGKIVEDIANVGSSFLVGNITGGTTENPYGVTQRGMIPSGGTKVVNASTNHFGDITTNNLDEYMKVLDRREAQKAQSGLGRWGNA